MTRDNLIGAFITGRKQAALHPGMADARPPAALAVPLAVVAIGASAYAATIIYPAAFTPGAQTKAGDQRTGEDAAKGEPEND